MRRPANLVLLGALFAALTVASSGTAADLPTYEEVLAGFPPGVRICNSSAGLERDPDGTWSFGHAGEETARIEIYEGEMQIFCPGAKFTVTETLTLDDGTVVRPGGKLTIDEDGEFVRISGWQGGPHQSFRAQVEDPTRRREQVAEAQGLLSELGYAPGPTDGMTGPSTRRAVREFQADRDLTVDGEITSQLIDQLRSEREAIPAAQPSPAVVDPQAYVGDWSGETNEGYPITLKVELRSGVAVVSEVTYKLTLRGRGVSASVAVLQPAQIAAEIRDGKFSHVSDFELHGEFVSGSHVDGTLAAADEHPQGLGWLRGKVTFSASPASEAELSAQVSPSPAPQEEQEAAPAEAESTTAPAEASARPPFRIRIDTGGDETDSEQEGATAEPAEDVGTADPVPDDLEPSTAPPVETASIVDAEGVVLAAAQPEELWGYIDTSGSWVIEPRFDGAKEFSEGLAAVQVGDEWGYINVSGQFVIAPQYGWGGLFSEGLAGVGVGEQRGVIDQTGQMVIGPLEVESMHSFFEGMALVETKEGEASRWGYIDRSGRMVVEPQYDFALSFSSGLAPFRQDEKWGFIDTMGRVVIEPRFEVALPFSEGLAIVKDGRRWGYIDNTGQMVIKHSYSCGGLSRLYLVLGLCSFSDGLAWLQEGEAWVLIDKSGKKLLKWPDAVSSFSEGLASVKGDDGRGFIDRTGKIVINLEYNNVWSFSQGLVKVGIEGLYGYMNATGRMVIEPRFKDAGDFRDASTTAAKPF